LTEIYPSVFRRDQVQAKRCKLLYTLWELESAGTNVAIKDQQAIRSQAAADLMKNKLNILKMLEQVANDYKRICILRQPEGIELNHRVMQALISTNLRLPDCGSKFGFTRAFIAVTRLEYAPVSKPPICRSIPTTQ